MQHEHHPRHDHQPSDPARAAAGLNSVAFQATLHCLSGCAVGEVLGMVLGTALALSSGTTVVLSIALAFAFGYAFTMAPLLRAGLPARRAMQLALAADTASIAVMEVVDNLVMLVIPGAMGATLASGLFWVSLALSLLLAGAAAFPINRWLIGHGRGHAVVHAHHSHG